MNPAIIVVILALGIVFYLITTYNWFQTTLTRIKASIQEIESGSLKNMNDAADKVSSLLPKLQILVESNPELKAEKVVTRLMDELRDTADKLLYARRTFIDLSADFNQRLVTFPSSLVGSLFGFKPQAGLETPTEGAHLSVSESEAKEHKVSL